MDQRTQFVGEHLRGGRTITELCDDYGVSRKTGYKWIERYLRQGAAGLEERSRRPRRSPRTGDGRYCYPLTVTDGFSRYLLGCQALNSTAGVEAKPVFTRLFQEYGLPRRIRTDNGVPFATTTLARLSKAWWVRLGILPEFIEPGRPDQNGRHERMHRTLKAATTRPAAGSLAAQQRRFNTFREEFNHERPHEALDQQTPASCYATSTRDAGAAART
jgi:transposase InsO family protein